MILRALAFAARSLVRQPGRAAVGVLGIAAVGALLFDMLLLSRGLVVSFRDLLDRVGFDVRVLSTEGVPLAGPRVQHAGALARQLRALPEIADVVPVRMMDGEVALPQRRPAQFSLMGVDVANRRPWTVVAGDDLAPDAEDAAAPALLVNRRLAATLGVSPGSTVQVRVTCAPDHAALPPRPFRIRGIAEFPF